jgi:hypothetical protein
VTTRTTAKAQVSRSSSTEEITSRRQAAIPGILAGESCDAVEQQRLGYWYRIPAPQPAQPTLGPHRFAGLALGKAADPKTGFCATRPSPSAEL